MVREYKGSHSGEHGDGLVRSEFNEPMFGSRLARAFEEVKDRFDPNGLYNPGKVVRPPKFDDRCAVPLRARLSRRGHQHASRLVGLSRQRRRFPGRGRDVQQQRRLPQTRRRRHVPELSRHPRRARRHARPRQYAAARDHRATRARTRWPRDEMAETLKLCVSCKACRRECPTGVDMARMKIEVQAARAAKHGFRCTTGWSAICRATRPMPRGCRGCSICATASPTLRAAVRTARRLFGAAQPAAMARGHFPRPLRLVRRGDAEGDQRAKSCCSPTHSTAISSAKISTPRSSVLAAGGYRVHAAHAGGRRRAAAVLRPHVPLGRRGRRGAARDASARSPRSRLMSTRGVPVIGLEPSCLFTLPRRIAGAAARTTRRTRWPANAMLFEEFLAREHEEGRLDLPLGPLPKKALLHGHCHQKAFDAMGAVERVLSMSRSSRWRPSSRAAAAWPARSAMPPTPSTSRSRWANCRCCRRCARRQPTRSSSPTAPRAGTRSTTARGREALHVARVLAMSVAAATPRPAA